MEKLYRALFVSFLAIIAITITSCEDDEICPGITCAIGQLQLIDCTCIEDPSNGSSSGEQIVSENITEDVTWTSDICYILGGRIVVEAGATLTIEPGTLIKGETGQGTNSTSLLVARGATINAEGTADAPIIFTSVADEIQQGMIASPNLDSSISGLWGGVLILGNAPISADAEAVQIEGVPPSDQNGLYGGTDPNDNSGVFRFVSIRHGGTDIGEGNEINGLTLGGVGNGTTIDHVEIIANVDDGIEFFGGTVNCSDLIVVMQGDDAFDGDQGYSGTVNNFVSIAGSESDHALEFDGPEGATNGTYTFTNGTCRGFNVDGVDGGEYADFRSNLMANLSDVYFFNFSETSDFELDNDGVAANYLDGLITTSGLEFNVSHLTGGNLDCESIMQDNSTEGTAFDQIDPGCSIVTDPSVGANTSEFNGWTWAQASGILNF